MERAPIVAAEDLNRVHSVLVWLTQVHGWLDQEVKAEREVRAKMQFDEDGDLPLALNDADKMLAGMGQAIEALGQIRTGSGTIASDHSKSTDLAKEGR